MTSKYVCITEDVRVRKDGLDFDIMIPDEHQTKGWYSVRKLIENTMWVVDKHSRDTLLKLNNAQERLYFEICERLRDKKPCKFVILKGRQLGFTTFISAFNFVMTFFRKNQNCVVIANTTDNTSMIFKKYQHYYYKLKEKNPILAPILQNLSGNRMMTQDTESSVRVAPATDNAVVGTTVQMVHLSECGRMSNMSEIMEAVSAAVPSVRENPVTFVFLESTAKGYNDFKAYWDNAIAEGGKKSYVPMFFAWFDNPEYVEDYDGFELMPEEKAVQEKYKLSNEQMSFYRSRLLDYHNSWKSIRQEFPCCPTEAFVATGSGVFDNELVQARKEVVTKLDYKDGFFGYNIKALSTDDFMVFDKKFVTNDGGATRIYELPKKGVPYVLGVDTAEGSGNDSTVGFVIRNDTKKQVAIWSSNSTDGDQAAIQLYCLGMFYQNALIAVENNKSSTITRMLKRCNYPNLYMRTDNDEKSYDNIQMMYGVKTTSHNKPIMKDLAIEICREDNYENVVDYETLCEMESFIYEESDKSNAIKIKAAGNKHDDRVMAMLITYYVSDQQTALCHTDEVATKRKICWELDDSSEEDNIATEEFQDYGNQRLNY